MELDMKLDRKAYNPIVSIRGYCRQSCKWKSVEMSSAHQRVSRELVKG